MIDTEKYEGHMREYNLEIRAWGDDTNANDKERCATDALLNDAPLLLAEVIRLRKKNYKLERFVENIEWGLKEEVE